MWCCYKKQISSVRDLNVQDKIIVVHSILLHNRYPGSDCLLLVLEVSDENGTAPQRGATIMQATYRLCANKCMHPHRVKSWVCTSVATRLASMQIRITRFHSLFFARTWCLSYLPTKQVLALVVTGRLDLRGVLEGRRSSRRKGISRESGQQLTDSYT